MRTYGRADWQAAQRAWAEGEFAAEWRPWREQAARRGIIYPPAGSRWDSWAEDSPSQRAMLVRAMSESPALLSAAIAHAHSWQGVIAYVLARRDEWRAQLNEAEREGRAQPTTTRQAAQSLRSILERLSGSQS